jgi:hypothetical protein
MKKYCRLEQRTKHLVSASRGKVAAGLWRSLFSGVCSPLQQ